MPQLTLPYEVHGKPGISCGHTSQTRIEHRRRWRSNPACPQQLSLPVPNRWLLWTAAGVASQLYVGFKQTQRKSTRKPASCCMSLPSDAQQAPASPSGLISPDHATTMHYAGKLPKGCVKDSMNNSSIFMQAAMADADAEGTNVEEYLAKAAKKARAFQASDVLHDRQELLELLTPLLHRQGVYALMLGGNFLGKSTVIEHFIKVNNEDWDAPLQRGAQAADDEMPPIIIKVDCRDMDVDELHLEKTLAKAALAHPALKSPFTEWLRGVAKTWGVLGAPVTAGLAGEADVGGRAGIKLFDRALASIGPAATLKSTMELAKECGSFLVLVIDETNLALPGADSLNEEKADSVRKFLSALYKMTSESKASCLLVASDQAYRERLTKLGFNLLKLTHTMQAGEVPPWSMRELLDQWGLGLNLTNQMMAHFGGHIHFTILALEELAQIGDAFSASSLTPMQTIRSRCEKVMQDHPEALDMLSKLAVEGYVVLPSMEDPIAQMLCRLDLASIVRVGPRVVGLRPEMMKDLRNEVVVIPPCQATRCVIDALLH